MKITTLIQKYGKYVMVLTAGLIVGGFSMRMASASVPDGNGTIHGCRNTITTMLRVIDSAGASCGSDEAGLNWDQDGVKGYAHVVISGGTYALDTAHSKNVSNLVVGPVNVDGFLGPICMTLATTPHNAAVSAPGIGFVSIKDGSGNWTESNACESLSSTANVGYFIGNDSYRFSVTIF